MFRIRIYGISGIFRISIRPDCAFLYNRNPAKTEMDDFRLANSDFCPVIPAKAGIQRGEREVGVFVRIRISIRGAAKRERNGEDMPGVQ